MAEACSLITGSNSTKATDANIAVAVMECIGNQSQENDFSDITIIVDGVEFRSHRFILSAVSGFFRGLLSSGMVEDIQRRAHVRGISQDIFNLILKCIFHAEDILKTENMIDVWHAANLLDIPFLLTRCEVFITDHLTAHNCIDVYQNAKLLDRNTIMMLAWEIMLHDFDEIRLSNEMLTLSLVEMKKLVKSNNLKTKSEDDVIDLIMRWIPHNQPVRKYESLEQVFFREREMRSADKNNATEHSLIERLHKKIFTSEGKNIEANTSRNQTVRYGAAVDNGIPGDNKNYNLAISENLGENDRASSAVKLLKCARFCLISGWTLQEMLGNKLILSTDEAVTLIKEAIHYQVEPSRRHDNLPLAAIYRTSSDLENVIIWTKDGLDARGVEVTFLNSMSVVTSEVRELSFGEKIDNCRFAVNGNYIFVADRKQCRRFYCLDKNVDNLSWFYPRIGHTVVSVGDCIYVVGGCQKHVQRLNINRSNMTERVGSIPVVVNNTRAGVIRRTIVLLGSSDGAAGVTVVQCFNTQNMTAQRLTDIKSPPQNYVIFHKGNRMFVLFGSGAVWILEESEADKISIRYLLQLWKFDRQLNGAVLIGHELFLFHDVKPSTVGPVSDITLPDVFKSIKNITQKGYGFHIAVMPKEQTVLSGITRSTRNFY